MPVAGIGRPPSSRRARHRPLDRAVPVAQARPRERPRSAGPGSRGSRAGGRRGTRPNSHGRAGRGAHARATSRIARATTYATTRPCHHQPVRQMGGRDLTPRERREREPPEPPPPRAREEPGRADQDERRPGERAGERQADRQDRRGDRHRDREPAGGAAAIRPSPSFRRNQNSPRPARIGFRTISARSPPPQPNIHDKAIVGSESHPLCGSAANEVPDISNGFHSGTWPSAIARPSMHERGSQKDRMSGCWSDRFGRNAMPRNAIRTDTTMSAGPAAAFTQPASRRGRGWLVGARGRRAAAASPSPSVQATEAASFLLRRGSVRLRAGSAPRITLRTPP